MKVIAFGTEPVGIIAIGQNATGVVAVGQMATGVIAIGQLARGVIVIGQLAIGVAGVGQLIVALTYGGGMLGIAGLRLPSLLVWGLAGEGHLRRNGGWRPWAEWRPQGSRLSVVRIAAFVVVAATVAIVALSWMPDFVDDEPAQSPPTTFEPGTR